MKREQSDRSFDSFPEQIKIDNIIFFNGIHIVQF